MVAFVDGTCGVCIGNLKHWKKFIDYIHQQNAACDFIFYIYCDDMNDFQKNIIQKLGLNITWIYDKDKKFMNSNKLYDQRFQTALLDKSNHVIMIGSMMFRKDLEALYKKTIIEKAK